MEPLDRFDRFDEVPVPDQSDDIVHRVERSADPLNGDDAWIEGSGSRRRRWGWLLIGAAASVLGLAAAFLVMDRISDGDDATGDVVTTPTTERVEQPPVIVSATELVEPPTSIADESADTTLSCSSAAELAAIGELLRTGQPVYDDQPARDVEQLIERADLVVSGDLVSAMRTATPNGFGLTEFEVTGVEALAGDAEVDRLVSPSDWALGQGVDPLVDRVAFEEVRFVAFLRSSSSAQGGWTPFVDGMVFGCNGVGSPPGEIGPNPIEPLGALPPGVLGMSIDEIADEVERIAAEPTEQAITRPVIQSAECERVSASEAAGTAPIEAVFFRRDEVFPIQIVGEPEATAADPFALIQRWDEVADEPMRGEISVVRGVDVAIGTFDNGNGEATWLLPDGSIGYLRSRGLDRGDIEDIVGSLRARPLDAPIPGFDIDATQARFDVLHEQLNTEPVQTFRAISQCLVGDGGSLHRVGALGGDPLWQHVAVIDAAPPDEVGLVDGTVLVLSGSDEFSLDDVVQAEFGEWAQLLEQPDVATQLNTPDDVPIVVGSRDDVELELFDATGSELTSGPLLVRLVEEIDAGSGERTGVFLEIDTSKITLHPDADVKVTYIDGRIRGRGTALVGPVSASRLPGNGSDLSDPFELSVRIVDGEPDDIGGEGDRTLQISPTIRLIPRDA